jgi:hypothetical protein
MEKTLLEVTRKSFGRFPLARGAYSTARSLLEREGSATGNSTAVEPFAIDAAIAALHRDSVSQPLRLRDDVVAGLQELGRCQPIRNPGQEFPLMTYDEVIQHNAAGRRPAFVYGSVPAAESDVTVQSVVDDPLILATATRYLRYLPRRRRLRLQWSFVCHLAPRQRMALGQTVFYHYDVDDFNFVYVMFYLTDTDAESGAHVMIPGTHRHKPFHWLLGRTWRTDDEVFAYYGRDRELVLNGPAGFGFIQDSSCMHKGLAPISRPRLVLQVRYS